MTMAQWTTTFGLKTMKMPEPKMKTFESKMSYVLRKSMFVSRFESWLNQSMYHTMADSLCRNIRWCFHYAQSVDFNVRTRCKSYQ